MDKGLFLVTANFLDKNDNQRHQRNEIIKIPEERGLRFAEQGLVRPLTPGDDKKTWPWGVFEGRHLCALPDDPIRTDRIVVCLNIWNDVDELEANYMSWYPYVDHVIAVDGAYAGTNTKHPYSTDGTLEFLRGLDKVQIVETEEFWPDQNIKRSAYFEHAEPGDLLWKIDADEFYMDAENVRDLPYFDVGWVRYKAPIYQRWQDIPVMFRYQPGLHYEYRHHYVYDADGNLVKTNQIGGKGYEHRLVDIRFRNSRGENRTAARTAVARKYRQEQWQNERRADPDKIVHGHEPLRILQLGPIDPGLVSYRFHTAINDTTPHESIQAITKQEWLQEPQQYKFIPDIELLRRAATSADIIHCHLTYHDLLTLGVETDAKIVMHHHGTMFRENPKQSRELDNRMSDVQLVSNYELLQYGDADYRWLPNPVPVARYSRYAEGKRGAWEYGKLKIAHSPTKKDNKDTWALQEAVKLLNKWGLELELVMIHKKPIEQCLKMKAECHITFDSFWLGLQCSGLEGAAMGQAVVAGDEYVAEQYKKHHGEVPYTFANTVDGLAAALEKLATNEAYYRRESERVYKYCVDVHDYPVVAERYLDILDERLDWRRKLRLGQDQPVKL